MGPAAIMRSISCRRKGGCTCSQPCEVAGRRGDDGVGRGRTWTSGSVDCGAFVVLGCSHLSKGVTVVNKVPGGLTDDQLAGLVWRKSRRSNPSGNCVEMAMVPDGGG